MSDIKMSELMHLPVHPYVTATGQGYAFDQAVFSQSKEQLGFEITSSECNSEEAVNGICHAINSHDAMAEQIKELKAALVEVLDCVDQDLVEDADSVRLEKAFCFAIKALKESEK